MDSRNLAEVAGRQEIHRISDLARRAGLMTDLYGSLNRVLVGRPHALGVIDREGHGLLLVDMLAGLERGREVLAVEVLRRGDQYRVDTLVVEEISVVEVSLRIRRNFFGVFQALGVDIRKCGEVGI